MRGRVRKIYRLNYGVEPRVPRGGLNWFVKPLVYRWPDLLKGLGLSFSVNERLVENYFILNAIPMHPSKKILDVGCCHSMLPFMLASAGHGVTGVDVHEVEWNHPNYTHIALPLGEAKKRLAGSKFDFVLCVSTFEHVGIAPPSEDAPETFAKDLASLVTKGGKVLLTSPFVEKTELVEGFEKRYSKQDLLELLGRTGLKATRYAVLMNAHLVELQKAK